jgi:hypothetical protein
MRTYPTLPLGASEYSPVHVEGVDVGPVAVRVGVYDVRGSR